MYSVISILDSDSTDAVKSLRSQLENHCKALRKGLVLDPHMSWLGAEGGNLSVIATRLNKLAQSLTPIKLETAGYGIFPGPTPVLYLPVIATDQLLKIHKKLWRLLSRDIIQGNVHYGPDQWMPHITVIYVDDKNASDLGCAIGKLLLKDFHLEFTISQFKLATYQNDQYGYYSTHSFS